MPSIILIASAVFPQSTLVTKGCTDRQIEQRTRLVRIVRLRYYRATRPKKISSYASPPLPFPHVTKIRAEKLVSAVAVLFKADSELHFNLCEQTQDQQCRTLIDRSLLELADMRCMDPTNLDLLSSEKSAVRHTASRWAAGWR